MRRRSLESPSSLCRDRCLELSAASAGTVCRKLVEFSATSAGTGCQKLGVFTWQARGWFSQKLVGISAAMSWDGRVSGSSDGRSGCKGTVQWDIATGAVAVMHDDG